MKEQIKLLRHIAIVLYHSINVKGYNIQEVQIMLLKKGCQLPSLFIALNPTPNDVYIQTKIIEQMETVLLDINDYEERREPEQRYTKVWYKKKMKKAYKNYTNDQIFLGSYFYNSLMLNY